MDKATKYISGRFMQGNRAKLSVYPQLVLFSVPPEQNLIAYYSVTEATDISDAATRLVVTAVSNTMIRNTLKGADIL